MTVDLLARLLQDKDEAVQLEAVRALSEHPAPQRFKVLFDVARNPEGKRYVRTQAVAGLAEKAHELAEDLLGFAEKDAALRDEVLRALVGVQLTPRQQERAATMAMGGRESEPLAARLVGKKFVEKRPAADDVNGWIEHLQGPGEEAAGRRIFFHSKLAGCYRCHRVDGRGQNVGPDLSSIGHADRRNILESILQPSNSIAPHYQAWQLATGDGKIHTGMLTRTYLDEYTYLDPKGALFKLKTIDIVENKAVPTSIMPNGLVDLLTDQELRDLLAYLGAKK